MLPPLERPDSGLSPFTLPCTRLLSLVGTEGLFLIHVAGEKDPTAAGTSPSRKRLKRKTGLASCQKTKTIEQKPAAHERQ